MSAMGYHSRTAHDLYRRFRCREAKQMHISETKRVDGRSASLVASTRQDILNRITVQPARQTVALRMTFLTLAIKRSGGLTKILRNLENRGKKPGIRLLRPKLR